MALLAIVLQVQSAGIELDFKVSFYIHLASFLCL
jgi:hypothetical protein